MQPSQVGTPAQPRRVSFTGVSRPYEETSHFVGSPEQARVGGSQESLNLGTTPGFGPSATTPTSSIPTYHGFPLARKRPSFGQPSRHSAPIDSNNRDRHPEHQWSLFGQMMENEGFLSPSSTSSVHGQQDSEDDFFAKHVSGTSSGLSPRIHGLGSSSFRHNTLRTASPARSSVFNGEEYDSDRDSQHTTIPQTVNLPQASSSWLDNIPVKLLYSSPIFRNLLKCSIAYFVASLFTFSPTLSKVLTDMDSSTPSASAHMVATIVVYFNPAKTVGAMLEADMFCLFGVLYASFVCLVSMTMFWWLEVKPGWESVADIVALAWIGISVGTLAWMKVWMENPSFNTACSMTAILIFVVIIKEGGLQTLLQVSGIILCGSVIANLVCFTFWPQSAINNLQLSMTNTLESFSTLLPMITRIFLLETDTAAHAQDMDKIQKAVEAHQNSFTSLQKNLREAKSEWILTRATSSENEEIGLDGGSVSISGRRSYEDAVDCLNRLAQHLNGLRSGTRLQYDLTKVGIKSRPSHAGKGKTTDPDAENDEAAILRAAAAMFGDLVDELGPPLKALSVYNNLFLLLAINADILLVGSFDIYSWPIEGSLFGIPKGEKKTAESIQPHEFSDLVDGIEAALIRFESTSNHAVLRLYRRSDANAFFHPSSSTSSDLPTHGYENEGDNENVFLVYFFIFTLQEFAKELIALVDSIERIYCYEQQLLRRDPWWSRLIGWGRFPFASFDFFPKKNVYGPRKSLNLRRSLAYMIPRHRMAHPAFPKIRPHAPDTIQTPPRDQLSIVGKVNQTIWSIGKRLKERDTKYAIKAGAATVILALPAFVESTRPTFVDYWGDWALISFFVVISPTIGATNYLSFQRFLGTIFGAAVAVGLYNLLLENPVSLSLAGFVFSIPCFYFAVAKPKHLSASRFVLLTYNLTCLYCYNLRQKDISVIDIGFYRALAVTAGILWAAFVSRFWWPSEARRELSKSLSEFCLHIGWLYTRLVASNSFAPEYRRESSRTGTPIQAAVRNAQGTRLSNSVHEFMAMELHLQIKLIELQTLLSQAQHEPRLKGPFPVDMYRQILTSLQSILDKLHSMRCVTTKEEWYTSVRNDFIVPVNRERREMVGNIMLSFSILAASFHLKAPLPPYLPPVEKSRLRLVEAIRKLDVVKNRDAKVSRQLLFFAYALTMKGVTMELECLGRTLQNAFGVIGHTSEEFENLFLPLGDRSGSIDYVA